MSPLKSPLWYVKGNSLVALTKLLTRSLVALSENVSIAQPPKRTPPSGPSHHRFPYTLDHSPRQFAIPMARLWKGIIRVAAPGCYVEVCSLRNTLQQLLTGATGTECRSGDNRHAPRRRPPRSIRFFSTSKRVYRRVAPTGSRMSKMAERRLRVTTPPESASSLHSQEAREGETACLARLAHRHGAVRSSNVRGG
jgi:hypothetical protein